MERIAIKKTINGLAWGAFATGVFLITGGGHMLAIGIMQ